MTYRETCVLLPCHSLEDFPMHHEGEAADGLLSAWTALWHPALLATTGLAPRWQRGDNPPTQLSDLLILVPGVSQKELPTDFAQRAAQEGAFLIAGDFPRDELLHRALEPVADLAQRLDEDLVADFLALGYCYLQVELLTRQMRYSTNLDELHFFKQVVAGAQAAAAGDVPTARDHLSSCFNLLAQERDHYYAVDVYVLDLTLVAPTTLGSPLEAQLAPKIPVNLLLNGELLTAMRVHAPDCLTAIKRGLQDGYVGLVGGEVAEHSAALQSCETVLNQLRQGLSVFQQQLGQRPKVYGRRRYGVSVLYPQLLGRLGYVGALHTALEDGQYPEGSQLKIRWEGPDRCAIDAISRAPLDATRPATFLALASKLGETMDMDHVATICLAHWPQRVCTWYHDLRRIARYGSMLGKFVTVDDYFRDTDYPGQTEQFKADQYRSPCLQQAVARRDVDPISSTVRYWHRRCLLAAQQAQDLLATAVGRYPVDTTSALIDEVDAGIGGTVAEDLDQRLAASQQRATRQFAEFLPRGTGPLETGYLVINPASHVRRAALDLSGLPSLPADSPPIYAADHRSAHKHVVVDVPPMGFAWITGAASRKPPRAEQRLLAEEGRLFNEFLEAHVNPTTGALQGLYEYEKRGNRLSQQLALRFPRHAPPVKRPATYTTMAADRVAVTAASAVLGEITVEGRLLDPRGETAATFRQRYRVWRGSRVLQLTIDLDPCTQLTDDPWNSYFCCRWAWANDTATLWRGVNQLRERGEAKRLEAPNYIDIDDDGRHTTLLTGGLPFHRRSDARMLDSILIVAGERARSFELGIGVNLKYPLQESLAFMTPLPTQKIEAPAVSGAASSWLFHIDSRNVLATAWMPLLEEGQVVGFRVRLLETAGRAARAKLQSCYPITVARRRDFVGENMGSCPLEKGAAVVEVSANCWIEVEARW